MNFIVAVDNNYAIGRNGGLIYSLPSDLKYFKQQTTGKVVVMGDRTYLSLPKHPLPNRINIVLTQMDYELEGAITCHNLTELGETLKNYNSNDVFVIGGGSVYNLLMPYCKYAYITKIDANEPADVYINNVEKQKNWKLVKQSELFTENNLNFKFCVFENSQIKELNNTLIK